MKTLRRTSSRVRNRTAFTLAGLGIFLGTGFAAGCGQGLRGYVTRGGISTVSLTSENDVRVSDPGITGVEVDVYARREGGADALIGSAVSGTDGSFRIPASGGFPKGEVLIVAEKEGFVSARRTLYAPADGQIWLVLLQPRNRAQEPPTEPAPPAGER